MHWSEIKHLKHWLQDFSFYVLFLMVLHNEMSSAYFWNHLNQILDRSITSLLFYHRNNHKSNQIKSKESGFKHHCISSSGISALACVANRAQSPHLWWTCVNASQACSHCPSLIFKAAAVNSHLEQMEVCRPQLLWTDVVWHRSCCKPNRPLNHLRLGMQTGWMWQTPCERTAG